MLQFTVIDSYHVHVYIHTHNTLVKIRHPWNNATNARVLLPRGLNLVLVGTVLVSSGDASNVNGGTFSTASRRILLRRCRVWIFRGEKDCAPMPSLRTSVWRERRCLSLWASHVRTYLLQSSFSLQIAPPFPSTNLVLKTKWFVKNVSFSFHPNR